MDEDMDRYDQKIQLLQSTIEEVRKKLHASMKNGNNEAFSLETYRLSDKLDKLIVEFLKVKEQMNDTSK
jgi:regulator of replication initiation timing